MLQQLLTVGQVATLARRASMSSSYKPALLKALLRIAAASPTLHISLETIGAEFLRLYWVQTVVFRLRQAASLTKEPQVVQAIRNAAASQRVRELRHLTPAVRSELEHQLARILPINVLDAFHASKPETMPFLFTRSAVGGIDFTLGSLSFLRENVAALESIANLWWARYLEKVNALAPLVIAKVERNGAQRGSLARYLTLLRSLDGPGCFYCERLLSGTLKAHVDHVIPWSFMLADPLWDLVLACEQCNLSKSDSLPAPAYFAKLTAYHAWRAKTALPSRLGSPLPDADEIARYYDAALSVEWPSGWKPPAIGAP